MRIVEIAQGVRAAELDPRTILNDCLNRIGRLESQLHAWVVLDAEGARSQAEQLFARHAAGETLGPLAGVCIGIKDNTDVAGWPTRVGSPITSSEPAAVDAALVAQLRKADAIILGKTVTTEFTYLDPSITCNPWNLERTPGGSSSGSAAAVASGTCPLATGSQTAGSVLRPASYCGTVGFKPTADAISAEGIFPLSKSLDTAGYFAQTAADMRALWTAIQSDEVSTQTTAAENSGETPAPWLFILEHFFLETSNTSVRRVAEEACYCLADFGAIYHVTGLPDSIGDVKENFLNLLAYEAAQHLGPLYALNASKFGPKVAAFVEQGRKTSADDYRQALAHWHEFGRDMDELMLVDQSAPQRMPAISKARPTCVLVLPSTLTTAPARDTTGDSSLNYPWTYAGLPAITIPCGCDEQGLPVGLQLVGRRGGDAELLNVAAWCEKQLAFAARPGVNAD